MKLFIHPHPSTYAEDGRGSGGIWRVINAEARYLPSFGVDIVDTPEESDVVNIHAGMLLDTLKPVVTSNHGLYWTGDMQWERLYWGYNVTCIEALRRANEIIVPSEWVAYPIKRDMRKVPHVIPHGINPDEFSLQKGHEGYVLWAKPRVDVVSDPVPMNTLAGMAKETSFVSTFGRGTANVQIIGALPYTEFQSVMGNAAIWLATARETGDIASREAMAQGIPVLGWNWGATGELIRHKETGYLATPGDFDDLLEGLHYCMEHRDRLGRDARNDVTARFPWARAIEQYAEVFRAAVEGEQYDYDVSIVVPSFNYAHFLPECLDSVFQSRFCQKHRVEVIVVNDASEDNTREVLAQSNCPGLRTLHHGRNGGLCATLNTGHHAAKGKYIVNLDADNLLLDDIGLLYDALESDPGLDVASGNLAMYQPSGHHIAAKDWPLGRITVEHQLNHYNQLPSTSMMRARSIKRLGGYRMRQKKNEDGEFWCRAMSAGLRFEQVTDKPVFVYRWHGENKSRIEGGEDDPEGPLAWNFYYPWHVYPTLTPFAQGGSPPIGSWEVRSYEQPEICVVIACGPGHEVYLMDALDSVTGQTFQQFECIVANDTGESLDVAALGHPWVKVVDTAGRQGPAIARNTAIAAAKAPLIVPLDADDMFYPDTLAMYYQAWARNPDNIVYSDCLTEDIPGRRDYYTCGPWSWPRIEREALYQVTILFAKQWWEAVGGYDINCDWEDWVFGLKLHLAGIGATYVKQPWGVYRHWTTGAGGVGSKSDGDNAGWGTEEFTERLDRVHQYIKEKEKAIMCKNCRSTAKARSITNIDMRTVTPPPDGEKWLVVYEGPKEGRFSVNSKVVRKKYRITRLRPFYVEKGDEWLAKSRDFARVELAPEPVATAALPTVIPTPVQLEVVPQSQPVINHATFNQPPLVEEERSNGHGRDLSRELDIALGTERTPISTLGDVLGGNIIDLLIGGGIVDVESVRHDIMNNRGRAILDIRGIGAGKLAAIRQVILA